MHHPRPGHGFGHAGACVRSPKSSISTTFPYALEIISDDLATLRWRSAGQQKAPVIVRTRGHRLEGVWHSGSPMAAVLNAIRGVYFCVPRDMTRAAGMYNTLLRSDDSAIVVEVLNGYRSKERRPSNVGEFTVPLGVPEVLRVGADLTLLTYGACCKVALAAAEKLALVGIDVEVIDAATLLPFDRPGAWSALPCAKPIACWWSTKTYPVAPPPTCCSRCSKGKTVMPGSTKSRAL